MIRWLVENVWPTALHTIIATTTAGLVSMLVIVPLRNEVRRLAHKLSASLDSLDPDVPVGLTKQLGEMSDELTQLNTHVGGTLRVKQAEPVEIRQHR